MANVKKQSISSENEIGKLIKIVVVLVLIFLGFYLLTVFINKEDEVEKQPEEVKIQYDNILVGNILTQPNDSYFVLVYASNDTNVDIYNGYLSNYTTNAIRVYYATLDSPYNQRFIGEETNTKIKTIDDLKLKGTTLLKIEKGKITKTLDTADGIKEYLKELTKKESK